ncbi:Lysophospholipid acyltransferase 5 [Merluccius polli]|uniref:Lysophospholipid acyltransferase 5 n=1 Tax=Merluccius polli TaxID=89951 RepID=A0AA47MCA5_MERPO|nr:Lysophospholipid acyltransferase 5 [Merluccius polli]
MAAPLLAKLSESLGSPEPAVRLILSVLIGYPCALVYRRFLFHQPVTVLHLFHTLSGLALAAFNFGSQIYHSAVCVLVQFLMLRLMGRTVTAVLSSFIFQMVYLLAGYYFTATEEYDIKWTMPHCVLTLKLIGLSFDYYDGGKDPSQLNAEQQKAALPAVPTLLEVCGFAYFYGGFLVGPQFTLRSYQSLVAGKLTDSPGKPPNSIMPAMQRFGLGLLCLTIYAIFSPHYADSYFLTDEYEAQPFWYRCVFILLWAKVILYKYVSCWVIAEGVCILSGLGYNGVDQNGNHQWDACANMKVWLFETTPLFTGTISSFNINTNAWVARHVFKRLKFLGNKILSQVATLLFLAIWHGLHSGYIICFSMEFIIVNVEKQIQALVKDSPALTKLANSPFYPLIYAVQQFIHWLFMGYPLVPFCLFTYDKWLKVYSSIYFCGHLFFFAAYLVLPYLRKALVPKDPQQREKKQD